MSLTVEDDGATAAEKGLIITHAGVKLTLMLHMRDQYNNKNLIKLDEFKSKVEVLITSQKGDYVQSIKAQGLEVVNESSEASL